MEREPALGLDFFWEQADSEDSADHPLERELCHRVDALERYLTMISEAQALGRDDMVDDLCAQHERQARLVREIQEALRRSRQQHYEGREDHTRATLPDSAGS